MARDTDGRIVEQSARGDSLAAFPCLSHMPKQGGRSPSELPVGTSGGDRIGAHVIARATWLPDLYSKPGRLGFWIIDLGTTRGYVGQHFGKLPELGFSYEIEALHAER